MDQREIYGLLSEAALPDTSYERLATIQSELGHATAAMRPDGTYMITGAASMAIATVDKLFNSAVQNDRKVLPLLFGAFAMLCGDRTDDQALFTNIDWSIPEQASGETSQ